MTGNIMWETFHDREYYVGNVSQQGKLFRKRFMTGNIM